MVSPTSGEVDCALLKEWTLRVFSCAQDNIEPINISVEEEEEEEIDEGKEEEERRRNRRRRQRRRKSHFCELWRKYYHFPHYMNSGGMEDVTW